MADRSLQARWQLRALVFALALVIGLGALASAASADRAPRTNPQGGQPVGQNANGVAGQSSGGAAPAQSGDHADRGSAEQSPADTATADNSGAAGGGSDSAVGMTDSGAVGAQSGDNSGGTAPSPDQGNARPARETTTTDGSTTDGGAAPATTADTGTSPNATAADSGACLSSDDAQMLSLINNYRAENGLGPLTASPTLTDAAQYHSADMANGNYFSHDVQGVGSWSDNISNSGYDSMGRGENIAAGNTDPAATFQQWVNSPGHRANMLNPSYTAIGIGDASNSGSDYGTYWTTTFGDTVDAPACTG